MADETQSTEAEQADSNPATANQPPASVVTVYDTEGREHFAAPTSKWVVDGIEDGTLTEQPPAKTEEVLDGAEAGSTGDDSEPGTGDGGDGSGDGAAEEGSSSRRRRAGSA